VAAQSRCIAAVFFKVGMINRDSAYLWRSSLMVTVPVYLIYEDQMGVR
jgi:hypothetical protein